MMARRFDETLVIAADEVPSKGTTRDFLATHDQCAELAARFGYHAVGELRVGFELKPLAGGPMIRVCGQLDARIEQLCIVTGDPVPEVLDTVFEVIFAPSGMVEENLDLTLADADPPEPIGPDGIDLIEIAAQQLSLSAQEYPRSEGADFSTVLSDLPEARKRGLSDPEKDNPFAALASLKSNPKGD